MIAAVPAIPPVAAERQIPIVATTPVSANPVGDIEPIAVSPVARPITVIEAIALTTVPGIVPLLVFTID